MSRDKARETGKQLNLSTSNLPVAIGDSHFVLCYQCTKCSAGCPVVEAMDYPPHQILKMLNLGLLQEALASSTIWLCAGCQTCVVRCPMEINLPQVMDSLREQSIAQGVPAGQRRIATFYSEFLADVRQRGRVHELRQLLAYKIKAGDLVSDIGLGVRMLAKGRLALKPVRVNKVEQVQALFDKFKG